MSFGNLHTGLQKACLGDSSLQAIEVYPCKADLLHARAMHLAQAQVTVKVLSCLRLSTGSVVALRVIHVS